MSKASRSSHCARGCPARKDARILHHTAHWLDPFRAQPSEHGQPRGDGHDPSREAAEHLVSIRGRPFRPLPSRGRGGLRTSFPLPLPRGFLSLPRIRGRRGGNSSSRERSSSEAGRSPSCSCWGSAPCAPPPRKSWECGFLRSSKPGPRGPARSSSATRAETSRPRSSRSSTRPMFQNFGFEPPVAGRLRATSPSGPIRHPSAITLQAVLIDKEGKRSKPFPFTFDVQPARRPASASRQRQSRRSPSFTIETPHGMRFKVN